MPFEPVDTVADLDVYSGQRPSPNIVKINVLWRQASGGNITSVVWLMLVIFTRAIGMIVAFVGIVAPWLPRRSWNARGLWIICAGVPLTYMPVHLDTRFMLPVVPLLCIAAAVSLSPSTCVGRSKALPRRQGFEDALDVTGTFPPRAG